MGKGQAAAVVEGMEHTIYRVALSISAGSSIKVLQVYELALQGLDGRSKGFLLFNQNFSN